MPIILSAPAKRRTNARAKTMSRADKAEARVAEALRGGLVLHFSSAWGDGTVGPYHTAVGPKRYAFFRYGRRPLERQGTLLEVAGTAVSEAGLSNIIDALKATGKYVNLETPLSVQVSLVPAKRKNTRKPALPPMRNNGAAGSVVIYDASGRAVSKSKNLAGIIRHARNRLVSSVNVSPSGVLSIRWEDGTHVDTPFADPSVAVSWAQSREWLKETPVTRKNTRKAALPPMRNNGAYDDEAEKPLNPNHKRALRIVAAWEQGKQNKATRLTPRGREVLESLKAPAKRTNGSRSVVDAVAARELELYVENEASLIGPGNTLGANIMRMLAGRIVRGTYDNTKAWKAWVPLVTEGAKRYKREIGSLNASKATRDAVATRLSEAFESEVRSGALDPMKLLGARKNPATAVPPLSKWEKGDYAYVGKGRGMLQGLQLVIENFSTTGSAWVAYVRSSVDPDYIRVPADDRGTGFYGTTRDGLRREYSRFSHATPGAARAALAKASRWYGSRR